MQTTTQIQTSIQELNSLFNKMDNNIHLAKSKKEEGFKSYMDNFINDSKEIKEAYNFASLKSAKKYLIEKLEKEGLNNKIEKIYKCIFNLETKKIVIKKELVTLKSYTGKNCNEVKISEGVISFSDLVVISRLVTAAKIKEINSFMGIEAPAEYVRTVLDFIGSLKTDKPTMKKVVNTSAL